MTESKKRYVLLIDIFLLPSLVGLIDLIVRPRSNRGVDLELTGVSLSRGAEDEANLCTSLTAAPSLSSSTVIIFRSLSFSELSNFVSEYVSDFVIGVPNLECCRGGSIGDLYRSWKF